MCLLLCLTIKQVSLYKCCVSMQVTHELVHVTCHHVYYMHEFHHGMHDSPLLHHVDI